MILAKENGRDNLFISLGSFIIILNYYYFTILGFLILWQLYREFWKLNSVLSLSSLKQCLDVEELIYWWRAPYFFSFTKNIVVDKCWILDFTLTDLWCTHVLNIDWSFCVQIQINSNETFFLLNFDLNCSYYTPCRVSVIEKTHLFSLILWNIVIITFWFSSDVFFNLSQNKVQLSFPVN